MDTQQGLHMVQYPGSQVQLQKEKQSVNSAEMAYDWSLR